MTATDPPIAAFRTWLERRGLAEGTVDVYVRDTVAALDVGVCDRIRDPELAPKTRHRILAAVRNWAEFTDDAALTKELKRIRLPPSRRQGAKVPIARSHLFLVIDELAKADYIDGPTRASLGLMACRGFRCSDVLRILRSELVAATETSVLSFEAKGRKRLEWRMTAIWAPHIRTLAGADGDWNRVEDLISSGKSSARRKSAARALERALDEVGAACGVDGLHPHRLRRTYAVEYLRNMVGDPEALEKLKQQMGWSTIATALEYIDHARGTELDAAAEKIFAR